MTQTDADLIFTKVKSKAHRKIDYRGFQAAIPLVAEKRFPKTLKDEGLESMFPVR